MSKVFFLFSFIFLLQTSLFSQTLIITGTIVDENKNSISQASVSIVGKNILAESDQDGIYSLKLPASIKEGDIIILRVIKAGYEPYQRNSIAASGLSVNIKLKKQTLAERQEKRSIPTSSKDEISVIAFYSKRLKDNNSETRRHALEVLGNLHSIPKSTLNEIVKLIIYEQDTEVKIAAINAISTIGMRTKEVDEAYKIALKHSSPIIKVATLSALKQLKYLPFFENDLKITAKDKSLKVSIYAIDLLVKINPNIDTSFLSSLKFGILSDNKNIVEKSFEILGVLRKLPKSVQEEFKRLTQYSGIRIDLLDDQYQVSSQQDRELKDTIEKYYFQYLTDISKTDNSIVLDWIEKGNYNTEYLNNMWPEDTSKIKIMLKVSSFDYFKASHNKYQSLTSQVVKWGVDLLPFLLKTYELKNPWLLNSIITLDSGYTYLVDSAIASKNLKSNYFGLLAIAEKGLLANFIIMKEKILQLAFPTTIYEELRQKIADDAFELLFRYYDIDTEFRILEKIYNSNDVDICFLIRKSIKMNFSFEIQRAIWTNFRTNSQYCDTAYLSNFLITNSSKGLRLISDSIIFTTKNAGQDEPIFSYKPYYQLENCLLTTIPQLKENVVNIIPWILKMIPRHYDQAIICLKILVNKGYKIQIDKYLESIENIQLKRKIRKDLKRE
jgi:hypothetical protein